MYHPEKAHYIAVTGIIVKDGKFLIVRRADNEKFKPGWWTVPGGKLETSDYINKEMHFGGDQWYFVLEDAVRREVMEETGLKIKNIGYVTNLVFFRPDKIPTVVISFHADYDSGDIKLDDDHSDYAWVTLEEAKKYKLIEGIWEEIDMLDRKLKGEDVGEWSK